MRCAYWAGPSTSGRGHGVSWLTLVSVALNSGRELEEDAFGTMTDLSKAKVGVCVLRGLMPAQKVRKEIKSITSANARKTKPPMASAPDAEATALAARALKCLTRAYEMGAADGATAVCVRPCGSH